MLADRRALGHRGDHGRAEVLRVRAGEADPLDPVDRVAGAQQLLERAADVAAVGVDVLAEQRQLLHARAREALDLGQDLARPARDLAAAHRRHDAVRADRVAAHRDLHPGLEAALAVQRQPPRERALFGDPERAALDALAARAEPLAQVRDRARPEGDVHVRVEREQPLALRLGVAAADGDHLLRLALLQRARLGEVRGEALVGLLADRAGVEDEHVGLVLLPRLAEPELLEHALDPLRVVGVHLAAERRDVVAAHT